MKENSRKEIELEYWRLINEVGEKEMAAARLRQEAEELYRKAEKLLDEMGEDA